MPRYAFFLKIGTLVCLAFAGPARAELSVAPAVLHIISLPGSPSNSLALTVANSASKPQPVSVEAEYWKADPGWPTAGQWLHIEPVQFSLDAKASRVVNVVIGRPPAADREILVMIYVGTKITGEGQVQVNMRTGVPCYVYSGKSRHASLVIREAGWDAKHQAFTVKLENQGDIHLQPFGDILLKRTGRIMGKVTLSVAEPIFPSGVWSKSFAASPALLAGQNEAEAVLFYSDPYWRDSPMQVASKTIILP